MLLVAVISVERYTQPGDRIVYLQKLLVTDQSKALVQIKLRIPVRPLTNIEGQVRINTQKCVSEIYLKYNFLDRRFYKCGIRHA